MCTSTGGSRTPSTTSDGSLRTSPAVRPVSPKSCQSPQRTWARATPPAPAWATCDSRARSPSTPHPWAPPSLPSLPSVPPGKGARRQRSSSSSDAGVSPRCRRSRVRLMTRQADIATPRGREPRQGERLDPPGSRLPCGGSRSQTRLHRNWCPETTRRAASLTPTSNWRAPWATTWSCRGWWTSQS